MTNYKREYTLTNISKKFQALLRLITSETHKTNPPERSSPIAPILGRPSCDFPIHEHAPLPLEERSAIPRPFHPWTPAHPPDSLKKRISSYDEQSVEVFISNAIHLTPNHFPNRREIEESNFRTPNRERR